MTAILLTAASLTTFLVMTVADRGRPLLGVIWFGAIAVTCIAVAAWGLLTADWPVAALNTFLAAINAWVAWRYWNRRKRKRAAALIGEKSRARLAAMARKVREAALPRLAPGGAR